MRALYFPPESWMGILEAMAIPEIHLDYICMPATGDLANQGKQDVPEHLRPPMWQPDSLSYQCDWKIATGCVTLCSKYNPVVLNQRVQESKRLPVPRAKQHQLELHTPIPHVQSPVAGANEGIPRGPALGFRPKV